MALSKRYENETKDAILERMKSQISDDIDKRQGSVVHDLTSPAAIELAQAYIALDNVLTFGFASEDMPSEYLDKRVGELGVTRRPSVKAQGSIIFSGTDGTVIASGTQVYTDEENPVYFETTEAVTITGGTATVTARALVGGTSGNVGANRITLISGDLSGVTGVNNAQAFEGGVDTESDESLLQRYYDRARKPATSGNANQYEQWAKEVSGVGDVKIYPLWNGNGTVKVVLLDDNKRSPSQSIIDATTSYIEGVKPIGATATVTGAVETAIDISANITLVEGATLADATNEITEAVTKYLASLAFTDPIVRYAQIATIVLNAPSVLDYANLTVNSGTANIEIADGNVAVIGTVSLS